jgi:signal transduction histidine kinase
MFTVPIVMACLVAPPLSGIVVGLVSSIAIVVLGLSIGVQPNPFSISVNMLVAVLVWFLSFTLERAISHARRNQQNVNFYKDIFSHDINNILQNVKGTGEVIGMLLKEGDTQKALAMVGAIKEQSLRGANLVLNIRKLSEIEETMLVPRDIDIIPLMEDVVSLLRVAFPRKKVNITFTPPCHECIVIGHDLLRNVFENIIQNAIVHNEQDPANIEILLSKNDRAKLNKEDKNDTSLVKIEFIDNGIGIPAEVKTRIFQPGFFHDRKSSGLGLGLSLVKNVVSQLGGNIVVSDKDGSNPELGSRFTISLKAAATQGVDPS